MKKTRNIYTVQLLYTTLEMSKTEVWTQLTALDFTTTPEAKLGRTADYQIIQ